MRRAAGDLSQGAQKKHAQLNLNPAHTYYNTGSPRRQCNPGSEDTWDHRPAARAAAGRQGGPNSRGNGSRSPVITSAHRGSA
eukprot:SAG22_NODE_886_length_6665_cov_3.040359_6_plen_82_part_00